MKKTETFEPGKAYKSHKAEFDKRAAARRDQRAELKNKLADIEGKLTESREALESAKEKTDFKTFEKIRADINTLQGEKTALNDFLSSKGLIYTEVESKAARKELRGEYIEILEAYDNVVIEKIAEIKALRDQIENVMRLYTALDSDINKAAEGKTFITSLTSLTTKAWNSTAIMCVDTLYKKTL